MATHVDSSQGELNLHNIKRAALLIYGKKIRISTCNATESQYSFYIETYHLLCSFICL